jgi:hypothetical protein
MPNPFKLIKYELLYTDSITANGNPLLTQWQPLIHTMSTPYSHNGNPLFTQCQPLIHTMSTPYSHNGNPLLTQCQPLIHTMSTPSYVQNMVTYICLPSFILFLSPLLTSHRTSPH